LPPEIPELEAIRHVHLVAVAGTGMGTLACMLADRGFRVTGSDVAAYPPMGDQLHGAGIEVQKGFSPDHVRDLRPDLVVIGNAVRAENPEAQAVLEDGIPFLSFPDAVHHFFIRGKHSVVVAGTHGKTTTTSLIGWILTHSGCDPSILVGGVAENLGAGFRLGTGPHFVIEGDEYDTAFFDKTPKLLHYAPRTLLLTSCEFDHADIYDSLDQIEAAFALGVGMVPSDGVIVAASDSESVRRVISRSSAPVEGYGFRDPAVWKVSDVSFDAAGTQFNVWREDERVGQVRVPMHGRHNVENVLGAVAVCSSLGVDVEKAAAALAEFKGVRRRQQLRGEAAGMIVVEDFAHHPTAVRENLAAMRARFPDRRLWAVFEPRTNTSRRRFFEDDFSDALSGADQVVLAGVYRPDDIPEAERLRPARVVEALEKLGVVASTEPEVDDIIEVLVANRTGRDVALIMSNGEFGGIWERLLARLEQAENG
jgi:UDP-N-acetylmuramate: L-alanyl-gamma-D-glutamyl-meso-diaminopimelate ligase